MNGSSMRSTARAVLGTLLAVGPVATARCAERVSAEAVRYWGTCDASAAVALDRETLLVADDERNVLQVYPVDRSGGPLQSIPWGRQLDIPPDDEHPEADIEGATVLDGRIYWISSHGRNRKGKWRENRHRFFAMTVTKTQDGFAAEPFGTPCKTLAVDLVRDPRLRALGLAEALDFGDREDADLAPKEEGLNVEGLAAMADGRSLLIALRNPLHDGKAILVPLLNPAAVILQHARPEFGDPITLRLAALVDGKVVDLGVRSIEYSASLGAYLLVAGAADTTRAFALYQWSGGKDDPPKPLARATERIGRIPDFAPEALIVDPGAKSVRLFSDDGSLKVRVASPAECAEGTYENGWCEAKYLLDPRRRTFRGIRIDLE